MGRHSLAAPQRAFRWGQPVGYAALFVGMGPAFARLAILAHEAAHRLLFCNRRANDLVGRWLLAGPAFVPFALYRRSHFAPHREAFGPGEPDLALSLLPLSEPPRPY